MDDKSLKRLVEDELEWDPSFDGNDIGVAVENGIVRLSGYVATFAQKFDVEAAVKRVNGVRGYVEDLQVRAFAQPYSDEAIAVQVANAVDWNAAVPKGAVKAKVEGGHVTLSGKVNWQYQKTAAENAVRPLAGVRSVVNTIDVKPHVQPGDIKKRIEDALARQAASDAGRIRVTVDGNTVRLEGSVRAWFERDLAERAAWSAPGVTTVEDKVSIGI